MRKISLLLSLALSLSIAQNLQGATPTQSDAELNNQGVAALRGKEFELAERKFRAALAVNPRYRYGAENLAICLNNLALIQLPTKAIESLHLAYYIDGNPVTAENLVLVRDQLGYRKGDFKEHCRCAERALVDGDVVGGIVEYELALKLKNDSGVRSRLNAIKVPPGTPPRLRNLPQPKQVDNTNYVGMIEKVEQRIYQFWKPKSADRSKLVIVAFGLRQDGTLSFLELKQSSGDKANDAIALAAVRAAVPFPEVPRTPTGNPVAIEFSFKYNVKGKYTVNPRVPQAAISRSKSHASAKFVPGKR